MTQKLVYERENSYLYGSKWSMKTVINTYYNSIFLEDRIALFEIALIYKNTRKYALHKE